MDMPNPTACSTTRERVLAEYASEAEYAYLMLIAPTGAEKPLPDGVTTIPFSEMVPPVDVPVVGVLFGGNTTAGGVPSKVYVLNR